MPVCNKFAARHFFLAQRCLLSNAQRILRENNPKAMNALKDYLIQHLHGISLSKPVVGIYYPSFNEPNIINSINKINNNLLNDINHLSLNFKKNIVWALPVVVKYASPLHFARWNLKADTLIQGRYNIPIPKAVEWVIPNIVLIPCVAYCYNRTTDLYYRLGYGGGFYDRTLAALLNDNPNLISIGIAYYEACYDYNQITMNEFDRPLDYLITI